MKYEIINPSDYCTIDAPSETLAGAAVLLLGEGKYGVATIDGDGTRILPLFPFGGHETWLREHAIDPDGFSAWIGEHLVELADALDTVALRPGAERSSLNDICGYAKALARAFRSSHAQKQHGGSPR